MSDNQNNDPLPGPIGDYEPIESLGIGATGTVYRGRHKDTGEEVAIKVLHSRRAADSNAAARFIRGALAARDLNHPNIVQIKAAGNTTSTYYLIMDLIDGRSVEQHLKETGRPMALKSAWELSLDMAKAIAYAHSKDIIHRNLSPSNLLIQKDGTAKLCGFGLAKFLSESRFAQVTSVGEQTVIGEIGFTSLEQLREPSTVDKRGDIFSIGAVMYSMLTGRPPYQGSLFAAYEDMQSATYPNPKELNPEVTDGFVEIIQTCLAVDPKERYETADLLLTALVAVGNIEGLAS